VIQKSVIGFGGIFIFATGCIEYVQAHTLLRHQLCLLIAIGRFLNPLCIPEGRDLTL
jgi:hypothetical protein